MRDLAGSGGIWRDLAGYAGYAGFVVVRGGWCCDWRLRAKAPERAARIAALAWDSSVALVEIMTLPLRSNRKRCLRWAPAPYQSKSFARNEADWNCAKCFAGWGEAGTTMVFMC
jgi:hypothetical protein